MIQKKKEQHTKIDFLHFFTLNIYIIFCSFNNRML